MSKLSKEDVLKLARLSRLRLSDEEISRYQEELSDILQYVEQLDNVDVSELQPTYQVTGLTTQDENASRKDEVTSQTSRDDLLKNVPKIENGHIKVKRMIS